jgi:hypothetical protein
MPIRQQYQHRIRVPREQLYFKRWVFVQDVVLTSERITIRFSPEPIKTGPFCARFLLKNMVNGNEDIREIDDFDIGAYSDGMHIDITLKSKSWAHYRFRIELDGHLAYQNDYREEDEIPF